MTAPSCDFGSLGVSWSGDPPPPQSHSSGEPLVSSPPPLSSSPVLVSMPWEVPHESSTGALADLLNRRGEREEGEKEGRERRERERRERERRERKGGRERREREEEGEKGRERERRERYCLKKVCACTSLLLSLSHTLSFSLSLRAYKSSISHSGSYRRETETCLSLLRQLRSHN